MSEEDLVWLLKSVGKVKKNRKFIIKLLKIDIFLKSAGHFETLYGVSFKIPDIICFKNGEPKFWFYMEKVSIYSFFLISNFEF